MKFDETIFVKSRASLLFEPILGIRKRAFEIEDVTSPHFLAPNLIAIPDDAPSEIPRIEMRSTNGHTSLTFSQLRADMVTEYDGKYNKDPELCFGYIEEKGKILSKAIEIIQPDIAVTALSLTVRWPERNMKEEDALAFMTETFLSACMAKNSSFDFRVNSTILIDEGLYQLVTLNNYRVYTSKTPIESPHPSLATMDLKEYGLEMEIEVNDKYNLNARGDRSKGLERLDEFMDVLRSNVEMPPCV